MTKDNTSAPGPQAWFADVPRRLTLQNGLSEKLETFVDHWMLDYYDPPEDVVSVVRQIISLALNASHDCAIAATSGVTQSPASSRNTPSTEGCRHPEGRGHDAGETASPIGLADEIVAMAKVIEGVMINHDRPASYWDCECAARAVLTHLHAQRKASDVRNIVMTEDQIKHMVDRFLMWKLPANFSPDDGISFDKIASRGTPHEYTRTPSGTNLFGYEEAAAMVRHMIEGLPSAPLQTCVAGSVPEGWKLVPVKPTTAMLGDAHATVPGVCDVCPADIEDIWETMLSASPSPPVIESGGKLLEALIEATDGWQDCANYKGQYLAEKHGDFEGVAKMRALIAELHRESQTVGGESDADASSVKTSQAIASGDEGGAA
jgi:hypothetical protein